jgi:hypothetical protein
MRFWRAQIDFLTPAGRLRQWEGIVEAETAEQATQRAMEDFRSFRPRRQLPEVAGFQLEPVEDSELP